MPKNANRYYWLCQIGGWGFIGLSLIVANTLVLESTKSDINLIYIFAAMYVSLGLIGTHLFRAVIRRSGWLQLPVEKAFPKFVIGIVLTCVGCGLVRIGVADISGLVNTKKTPDFFTELMALSAENGVTIIPWTLIYYFYHYIENSRKQQLDTLKLEALVKELELKTIKAHINPHFIFNALNSIRALIDENPARARKAVTELSNILRSSMQAEKLETVTFEKELNIVKDYLALEYIRFEERLQVEYEIDEDTLDQPIPPMMLQTLVENAIKHGISRQVDGGKVKIVSDFREDYHELLIVNTGALNGNRDVDGFGLASTKNRLQILFGQKANFDIRQIEGNSVQARVLIPVDGK
ncbi:MAG TPA: histidine kinase [Puia sp.]|nr:histidine kinase [Puia sp.]